MVTKKCSRARVVADFEQGLSGAVKRVFPEAKIKGCVFHWTQAIWRKTQKLGLQRSYQEEDSIHKFIRKLMTLPFLPHEHIEPSFRKLQQKAQPGPVADLVQYIHTNWMNSSVWSIKSWCIYRQPTRTNNVVEGWHRRLNNKAGEQQKPFYILIPLLAKEANLVPLQSKLTSEGKLKRYQRVATRSFQGTLFQLWDDYKNNITVSQLLRQDSRIYGPTQED